MIMIATPSPFLVGDFQHADPDGYAVIEFLWLEIGDAAFSIRPELFRDLEWLDARVWAAMRRLFAHEILAQIDETVH
jgi:hypothetical protein